MGVGVKPDAIDVKFVSGSLLAIATIAPPADSVPLLAAKLKLAGTQQALGRTLEQRVCALDGINLIRESNKESIAVDVTDVKQLSKADVEKQREADAAVKIQSVSRARKS